MRVGIDARLLAYGHGGIARYVEELTSAIAHRHTNVDLRILRSRKDPTSHHDRVARLWTPPHHRFEHVTLPLELAVQRLDIVHSPDHVAPLPLGYHTVVSVHDLAFLLFPDTHTEESRRYYQQMQASLDRAARIITVSQQTRSDLLAHTPVDPSRVTTIYNGIHPRFHPRPDGVVTPEEHLVLDRFGLPEGYMLTVGTISPRKNLMTLLDALARLRPRHRSLHLAVVGEHGWLTQPTLDRIRTLGLQRTVHLLGGVDEADLVTLYRSARLFVYPSLYEGFAFPPLEAMACGTPVVTSSSGSIPEVTGDAAILVDSRDAGRLAWEIEETLANRERRQQLRERGLQRARLFTWERCAQETVAVYRAVAEG